MIIIWGSINAGKVDEVRGGMFHVVTKFGHLYYIPLIPTGSFVVLEKYGDGSFRGAPIPMSWKSILAGWFRGGCILAMVGAILGMFAMRFSPNAPPLGWIAPMLLGLMAAAALALSYKLKVFTEAPYERAMELARFVGLNETGRLMLEVAYGRLSAVQADEKLARIEEELEAQNGLEPLVAEVLD